MKKLLLIILLFGTSLGVFAKDCLASKLPNLKGIDSITYLEEYRPKLLRSGWKPIKLSRIEKDSPLYNKDYPERYCSAIVCISSFTDKKKNKLTLTITDFVEDVKVECFKP